MVRFFFLLFLVLFSPRAFVSCAQPVVISGSSPSNANSSLEFLKTTDWITGTEEVAGTCQVDENGDFRIEIVLAETEQLYLYLGIYRGFFYAEPGKSYQLVLPERIDKSPEDLLNPYFEPVEVHLGLSNFSNSELNMLIMMFDDAYIPYYDKHVNNLYVKTDMSRLEEDIQNIENSFHLSPGDFFRQYRHYHYGMLKLLANQQRVQSLSDEYFNNLSVQYNNPAYAGLFNQVYNKYFVFFSRTPEGSRIFTDINQSGSYRALSATLSGTSNFSNDTLRELIVLKQIHDEFYGNQFSRTGLIKILDSLMIGTTIERHREVGKNIREKITRLQPGYEPPQFELLDTDGNLVKLSDFRGRYVYLNFCTCQSYACLNEFNMLTTLHQKHKDRLVILTIATDPMEEILRQFLAKNKYDWKFLHYDNQPSVIRDYDIRAFPTYFLIGPDGKLIFSPADSPAENFEQKLFEAMRSRGDL
jgi:peroxiredoxin